MVGLPVMQVTLQVNGRYKRYILFSLERTSRRGAFKSSSIRPFCTNGCGPLGSVQRHPGPIAQLVRAHA